MSVWAQFTNYVDVYGDLNADQFSGGSRPYFGDRISAFDQLLSALSPGQAVIQKVDNLLSLLKCAAQMRFPIYQQNFWRRQKIMERCWSGSAEPFPPDSPKMDLDTVASTRTKELTKALHSGGLPTEALTRGYSRVLLQVVLPADIANDLAYISTDWQNKSGLPPGHEHEEWAGVSFLEAYSKLKNTGEGDGFTARVLLRRAPFYTWDTVELTAYSQVFLDEDFMEFAESILNDIRGYVLGTPQATHSHWHFLEILGVVVLFLAGLVVLSIFLRYRQPRPSSTEAPARDVELQPAGSL
ncbi:kgd2 [Symbiodinium pilosum]|uniref:Kgd2 protein n=1 Tax=Symbiodinium pilosum TaxID=2952 RepID=A0A812VKZ4_SYMPI|nr:kgd2 [Symbiodinium pilosum]